MLPKAVQAQVELADQLSAKLNGEPPNTEEPPPAEPPPQEPPAPPPEPVSPEPPKATADEHTWEQKYKSLQGMFNAQVPQLHQQLKELQSQMQTLVAENTQLKTKPAEPPKTLITDADTEAFGSDLIDMVRRAAAEEAQKAAAREGMLQTRIDQLEAQLGQVGERQALTARDAFFRDLTVKVPDWEALNTDPGFLAWLGEPDPVYGVPRQSGLDKAVGSFNVEHAAQVFAAFKGTKAPAQRTTNNLERQVAPARSRSAAPPVANELQTAVWSQADIANFYDQWRRGNVPNDEAVRMEAEIHKAMAEGRIR